MRRTLIFGTLLLCLSLSSCQCAEPPPMAPVEDENEQAHAEPASESPSALRLV